MAIPEYWLSYNNGAEKLRFPVPPPVVNVSSPFTNTDIEIVSGKEFTIIGDRGLKEFSFQSFLPRDYNSTYCDYVDIPDPYKFINWIERWRNSKRPIRFMVTGTNINLPVTVRDFNYELERAGEPGDVYFNIVLKEYEFLTLGKKVDITKPAAPTKQTDRPPVVNKGSTATPSGTHIVKAGESLSKIAFAVYKDANRWKDIFNANKKLIGNNPDKITAGMKLVLPK
ncbi:LysM peptidoglycan-binding domain-containing protein [Sporosarcina sp. FSL K6-3508]|uniref:LysM peptidoglycan-binding domain-containing protein n=1 Tax=Sporosarcina sp. FSL K6-3508 TaxID=2921557 RepID=UPI003159F3E3